MVDAQTSSRFPHLRVEEWTHYFSAVGCLYSPGIAFLAIRSLPGHEVLQITAVPADPESISEFPSVSDGPTTFDLIPEQLRGHAEALARAFEGEYDCTLTEAMHRWVPHNGAVTIQWWGEQLLMQLHGADGEAFHGQLRPPVARDAVPRGTGLVVMSAMEVKDAELAKSITNFLGTWARSDARWLTNLKALGAAFPDLDRLLEWLPGTWWLRRGDSCCAELEVRGVGDGGAADRVLLGALGAEALSPSLAYEPAPSGQKAIVRGTGVYQVLAWSRAQMRAETDQS
jgi:hypothetical protein